MSRRVRWHGPSYYFDQPDDAPYVVLWKANRQSEIAHFDLIEAVALQKSLAAAISDLRALEETEQ